MNIVNVVLRKNSFLTMKMGSIGWAETSITNYHYALHNFPGERRSKPRTHFCAPYICAWLFLVHGLEFRVSGFEFLFRQRTRQYVALQVTPKLSLD